MTRAPNLTMSPKDSSHPRGTSIRSSMSLHDRGELRVRGEQNLGEHIVEGEDREERDHDGLVDGATDALGAARGGHPLVTADDRDDCPEQRRLDDRAPE